MQVPAAVDFGFVAAKETAQRTFYVKNQGETTLSFHWKTAAPFSVEPLDFSLVPGSSQLITATLAPEDAATYVSSVSFPRPSPAPAGDSANCLCHRPR